jgi:chromosome segregation ATPase
MEHIWTRSGQDTAGSSLAETMFVDNAFRDASLPRPQCLGVANLVAAIGALQGAHRAEVLGERRFELLRDQHARLELLREEHRVLLDELERERRQRLEAQERVKQLMREHPHLELERELQRLTEELGFEREGLTHNHRERRRLGEELERERLARLGDQRNVHRLERDLQELQQLLEVLQQALKAPKKGLWTNLLRSNNH